VFFFFFFYGHQNSFEEGILMVGRTVAYI